MSIKIGITGHRYLDNPKEVAEKISGILGDLMKDKESDELEACSCIALGSDTLFAEEVLKRNIPLHTIIPFQLLAYRKDMEKKSREDAAVFDRLAQHNPDILYTKPPTDDEHRKQLYLEAGKKLADNCDIIIAVWDGREYRETGGTAQIVQHAREQNKKLIFIKAFKSELRKRYEQSRKNAERFKKIYERAWIAGMLLGLAAAEILALSLSIIPATYKHPLAVAELCCVGALAVIIILIKTGRLKYMRVQNRRETERYRVLKDYYYGDLPIEDIGTTSDYLSEDLKKTEQKYTGVACTNPNVEQSLEALSSLVNKQVQYHTQDRPELKNRLFHFLEKTKVVLLFIFMLGVLAHFLAADHRTIFRLHIPHWAGLLFPLAIPPLYAAIESYIHFKEFHKIRHDSGKMLAFFAGITPKLEATSVRIK